MILTASMFKLLHGVIIRREAVAAWHDNLSKAIREKRVASDEDYEFSANYGAPDFDMRNRNHKTFIQELKRKQAIFEAYAERREAEKKVEDAKTAMEAEAEVANGEPGKSE